MSLLALLLTHLAMSVFKRAESWHLDIDRYLNRVIPASPLHKLPSPISRFLGYRKEQKQDVGNILGAFWSLIGAFCGLALVAAVFNNTASIQQHAPPALIASFVSLRIYRPFSCLICMCRAHQPSLSTTQSAHLWVNHATPYSGISSLLSLVWVCRSFSSTTLSTRTLNG